MKSSTCSRGVKLFVLSFLFTFVLSAVFEPEKKKPNILLILADDVGQGDLSAYFGSSAVSTPNIDALIGKGLMFTDTHSTPLCATSRYMLLSGNYQHRGRLVKGTWSITQNHNNFRMNQKSIAQVLRDEANYNTGMFGKWHLGGRIPPSGVVDDQLLLSSDSHDWAYPLGEGPNDIGFNTSYFSAEGIQRPPYSFFRNGFLDMAKGSEKYWVKGKYAMPLGQSHIIRDGEGSRDWDSTAYNMALVNETESFIQKHLEDKSSDEPFFAYVALGNVHVPHSPPDHYIDGTPIATKYDSAYLNMLFEMDKVVGSLVNLIESNGISENTIIIFTSDNGGLNGRDLGTEEIHSSSGKLRGYKGMIYEGGHRVPMIWRYDGVFPKGEKREHLLGLNDIYATLCELVGVPLPSKPSAQDSKSFKDYLFYKTNTENLREVLGHWRFKGKKIDAAALRQNNMKVIENYSKSTVELYDLDNDISEEKNLSSDPKYTNLITEMLATLRKVGPCPPNIKGKFPIVINEVIRHKKCRWISRKSKKRCKLYSSIAKENCPSICTRHRKFCESIRTNK